VAKKKEIVGTRRANRHHAGVLLHCLITVSERWV